VLARHRRVGPGEQLALTIGQRRLARLDEDRAAVPGRATEPRERRRRENLVAEQRAADDLASGPVPDRRVSRAPDVLFERVGDDTVLLDPASSLYTRLNATGTALWELLATPATAAELGDHLARTFDLEAATALADAERFLDSLRERGLIEPG
jgi:hypothetical protein